MNRLISSLKLNAIYALGLLALSLCTVLVRNGVFEFCTTQAFGFPFPWYCDWCLCERNNPPINPAFWAFNLLFAVLGSFPVASFVRARRRRVVSAG